MKQPMFGLKQLKALPFLVGLLFAFKSNSDIQPMLTTIKCIEYTTYGPPLIVLNEQPFNEVYKARLYLLDSIIVALLTYKSSKKDVVGNDIELSEFEKKKIYLVYEKDALYGYLYDTSAQRYRQRVKLDSVLKNQFFIEHDPYPLTIDNKVIALPKFSSAAKDTQYRQLVVRSKKDTMTGADFLLGYVKSNSKWGPSLREELDTMHKRELIFFGINFFMRKDTSRNSKIINYKLVTTKRHVLLPESFRLPILEDYLNRSSWE